MKVKTHLTALSLLLNMLSIMAQPVRTDWEQRITGDVHFHAVLEATNGYVLAVGETGTRTRGGADGLLVIADHSTGQIVAEQRFGGAKDDVFYSLVQTPEGLFLLGGRTASTGAGSDDAWLVLVNERGEQLWETTLGTAGKDACLHLCRLSDDAIALGGYQDGGRGGDVWLARWEQQRLVWEKNTGISEFETLAGLVAASDGSLVFCGNTGKKAGNGAGDIYLAKMNKRGELDWKKWFGEGGWEEALGLTATQDGGFAITGLTKSKGAGDLDAWLVKTSRDGFRQWDKTFGGKDADLANTLLQTEEGGFLLAGSTKSYRSGARFTKAYVVQTSAGGELQWEHHFGNDRDDVLQKAYPLHNGSMVFAASLDGGTAGLLRLSDPSATFALAGIRDAVNLGLSAPNLHSATKDALLPGERAYLALSIENTTGMDLPDVRVTVDNANTSLTAWGTNYLGSLRKGEQRLAHIPVEAYADFTPGVAKLNITVQSGTKSLSTLEHTLTLRKPQPATLLIADYQFVPSQRSDEIALKVQVENSGDSSSRAAEVRFELPGGLRAAGPVAFPMGVVGAHSRREVTLSFVKTAQFTESVARIPCIVLENSREKVRKTLEWQSSAAGQSNLVSSGPILIWTDPAPHETGSNKVRKNDNHFEFKMTVVSGKPLEPKNFKMKVNGVEMDGSKFNEEDLGQPKVENQQFTYTYRNKIPLQQGNNRVEVLVDGKVSDFLDVEFRPERANLHILTIGPQHADLRYTGKDASDFARAFENQGGEDKLFQQVFVRALTSPEQTNLTGIKQAAYDLAYQWDDQQIKPTDLLLVFVSSHGKIVENRFKILQTGYNPKYERLTVDFKSDLLEVLNNINCKKLIFIDACHSGGAKDGYGGLSSAVVDLAKAQPGVSTLTSCGSTEKSYENEVWENGAFTEALLEAFSNAPCQDGSGVFQADANADRILRLGELYEFLRRRVPAMVQSTIPNAPTSQTPFMPESQLDRDLPIYYLGGN